MHKININKGEYNLLKRKKNCNERIKENVK